jgi:hypothetical protein
VDYDPPSWHVDAQGIREDTRLHPTQNGLLTEHVIPYVIDSGPAKGTRHEVRVGPPDFTGEGVRQAIVVHANNVHQIASLAGGTA